ncbi:hypothetical protein F0562_012165 [Nyssa sinensis]|uniref:Uncharacterized protein n=1 Tax=Nyssa sinensis TaxID=561372 RepID=A0A5J4ZS31_9ASTE|nr:hypothetical protein F0562_012165 [Nyssa sinensis]
MEVATGVGWGKRPRSDRVFLGGVRMRGKNGVSGSGGGENVKVKMVMEYNEELILHEDEVDDIVFDYEASNDEDLEEEVVDTSFLYEVYSSRPYG